MSAHDIYDSEVDDYQQGLHIKENLLPYLYIYPDLQFINECILYLTNEIIYTHSVVHEAYSNWFMHPMYENINNSVLPLTKQNTGHITSK